MKKYPYDKINAAYRMMDKDYAKHMKKDGWYITKHFADQTKYSKTKYVLKAVFIVRFDYRTNKLMEADREQTLINIQRHGFKIDDSFTIIDFNMNKFQKNLYLWNCQDLGLL